jgi:hypothetical protein
MKQSLLSAPLLRTGFHILYKSCTDFEANATPGWEYMQLPKLGSHACASKLLDAADIVREAISRQSFNPNCLDI